MLERQQKRIRRHRRVRAKIKGTAKIPRLCVFRSAKHIYAQLIDDEKSHTLVAGSDLELKRRMQNVKQKTKKKETEKDGKKIITAKVTIAYEIGKLIAEKALKKKINEVVFDRGGYKYHGGVKALAEGARAGGLKL